MREQLAAAMVAENLNPDGAHVLYLGALSQASSMGDAALWFMLSDERGKLRQLAKDLAARLMGRTNQAADCMPIAMLVMVERLYAFCRACNGATNARNEFGVLVTCPTCNGLGKHRYEDTERALITGLHWRPKRHGRLLGIAQKLLSCHELDALAEVRAQLEKS